MRPDPLLGKTKSGVYAPEGIIEPRRLLDVMAPLCNPPFKDASKMLLITRSWEEEDIRQRITDVTPAV